MRFHVVTIFPDSFGPYLEQSIIGRARRHHQVAVRFYDPRDDTKYKHRKVDDKPYGGGPGMVLAAPPVTAAIARAMAVAKRGGGQTKVLIMSPRGKPFTNAMARRLAKTKTDLVLVSGRYEGIDARVKKIWRAEEISIGPYILTGGELPALVVMDAVARQVPGVLGDANSLEEERDTTGEVYTRPEIFKYKNKTYRVPAVLLSGDPKKIAQWRQSKSK